MSTNTDHNPQYNSSPFWDWEMFKLSAAALIGVGALAVTGARAVLGIHTEKAPQTAAAAIEKGRPLNIFEDGYAIVKVVDNNGNVVQTAKVIRPSLNTPAYDDGIGDIIYRATPNNAKDTEKPVLADFNSQEFYNSDPNATPDRVTFETFDGKTLSYQQALSSSTRARVDVPPAGPNVTSPYLTIAAGQPHAGEHVMQYTVVSGQPGQNS